MSRDPEILHNEIKDRLDRIIDLLTPKDCQPAPPKPIEVNYRDGTTEWVEPSGDTPIGDLTEEQLERGAQKLADAILEAAEPPDWVGPSERGIEAPQPPGPDWDWAEKEAREFCDEYADEVLIEKAKVALAALLRRVREGKP